MCMIHGIRELYLLLYHSGLKNEKQWNSSKSLSEHSDILDHIGSLNFKHSHLKWLTI